jgi:threonine/homoserine/homoserine lactone efflux protein
VTVFGLLVRGLLAGLAIAAPVGPVNVLCVSRTLRKGWRAALVSGLGAATADAFYGSIAAFSITFIIQLLIREEFWIRLIGGILLVVVGVSYCVKRPRSLDVEETGATKRSDFASAFLLTLMNPTTVLSFLAVLAALRVSQPEAWLLTWLLVLGIFSGSLLWWCALITIVNRFRSRFDDRMLLWMNRVAGVAIGGFGAFTLILSLVT